MPFDPEILFLGNNLRDPIAVAEVTCTKMLSAVAGGGG